MLPRIEVESAAVKRYALIITTVAAFLSPFGVSSVNIALPSIGKEFQMDAILLGWVTTAYVLASTIFLVPFGKMADMYGRKRIFTYGVLTFVAASFGASLSHSSRMLILFRILQGIGAAGNFCVGGAILSSIFTTEDLGKVMGINLAAVYVGYTAGPFLGGSLTEHLGWRSIFFVNVFLGLMIIAFTFWKLKGEWRESEKKKFDLPGATLYGITLLLVMYGFSQLSSATGVWLILAGALGALGFIKWEARMESPVLDMRLFRRNKVFWSFNVATLINYSATYAVGFLLSLYLQFIKNLPPQTAGLVLISQPIVQAAFSPVAGRLSDRIEPQRVASVGMAFTGVGLFLLALLSDASPIVFIVAVTAVIGLGIALFASPSIKAVLSSVESRHYGVASGAIGTMRGMGMVFSMGMTLLMFSIYIGEVQITPKYYPVFLKCTKTAFAFFAVICLVGVFTSLARGKPQRE
jgi:EmrB/QacA subfamily drug resistance transporter